MWCDLGKSVWSRTCDIFSWILFCSFEEVHLAENPTWIGPVVPIKVMSNWIILKTKEIHSFFWLYLTINAHDFWVIPLDGNTYYYTHVGTVLLLCKVVGFLIQSILQFQQTGKGNGCNYDTQCFLMTTKMCSGASLHVMRPYHSHYVSHLCIIPKGYVQLLLF